MLVVSKTFKRTIVFSTTRWRALFVAVHAGAVHAGAVQTMENMVSGEQREKAPNKSVKSGTQGATMATELHIYTVSMTKACLANWYQLKLQLAVGVPVKVSLPGRIYINILIISLLYQAFPPPPLHAPPS